MSRWRRVVPSWPKLHAYAQAKEGPGTDQNPRASSGAMPVGAIFRTSFSPVRPGAVQCCGGVGCRFVDCNFNHIALKSCGFRYANFSGCQLPFDELQHCLPPEPNLREDLTRNLSLESGRLGLVAEARRYRMAEIRAREENLRAAVLGQSSWYREHYDMVARSIALGGLILSLLNRWLWGYGQRSWVLALNLAIAGFGIFPVIFYLLRSGLQKPSLKTVTVPDLIYFSFNNLLPTGIHSGIHAVSLGTRIAAGTEAVLGIIAFALFASYIYRWSVHR